MLVLDWKDQAKLLYKLELHADGVAENNVDAVGIPWRWKQVLQDSRRDVKEMQKYTFYCKRRRKICIKNHEEGNVKPPHFIFP